MTAERGNRGRGFDRLVLYYADRIVAHQLSGIRGIRELALAMGNYDGWGNHGQPWSYSVMRRVLRRGAEMGVLFPCLTPSEAASKRVPNYRSRPRTYFAGQADAGSAQGDPS